jgi:hypothetical protein
MLELRSLDIVSKLMQVFGLRSGPRASIQEESEPSSAQEMLEVLKAFFDHWDSLTKDGLMPHLRAYLDRLLVKEPYMESFVAIGTFYSSVHGAIATPRILRSLRS